MTKNKRIVIVAALLVLIALLAFLYWFFLYQPELFSDFLKRGEIGASLRQGDGAQIVRGFLDSEQCWNYYEKMPEYDLWAEQILSYIGAVYAEEESGDIWYRPREHIRKKYYLILVKADGTASVWKPWESEVPIGAPT